MTVADLIPNRTLRDAIEEEKQSAAAFEALEYMNKRPCTRCAGYNIPAQRAAVEAAPIKPPAPNGIAVKIRELAKDGKLKNITSLESSYDISAVLDIGDTDGYTALMLASERGHDGVMVYLLDRGVNVNAKSHKGSTALMWACEFGHQNAVTLLIQRGANVNDTTNVGRTALMCACMNGHLGVANYLLQNGAIPDAVTFDDGFTALLLAASNFHIDVMRLLLSNSVNVNALTKDGRSSLSFACVRGDKSTINLLIENGINDHHGVCPLVIATEHNHLEVVHFLLERGFKNGLETALQIACDRGMLNILKALFATGYFQRSTPHTSNAFSTAVQRGHFGVATLLATNIDIPNDVKTEALDGLVNIINYRESYVVSNAGTSDINGVYFFSRMDKDGVPQYVKEPTRPDMPKLTICRHEKRDRRKLWFISKLDPLIPDSDSDIDFYQNNQANSSSEPPCTGWEPVLVQPRLNRIPSGSLPGPLLAKGTSGLQPEIVKFLLDSGAGVDPTKPSGFKLIVWTLTYGHADILKRILDIEGSVEHIKSMEIGLSAMSLAAERGDLATVKLLLDKGLTASSNNALLLAAGKQNIELLNMLLERVTYNSETLCSAIAIAVHENKGELVVPLIKRFQMATDDIASNYHIIVHTLLWAIQSDRYDLMELLLECGFDFGELLPEDAENILMVATEKGYHLNVIKLILDKVKIFSADSALILACSIGHLEIVELLLGRVPIDGDRKATALRIAADNQHVAIVRLLVLEHGTAIFTSDDSEERMKLLLGWLVTKAPDELPLFSFLLAFGARLDYTYENDQSLLTLACQTGKCALVKMLLERGADVNSVTSKGHTALMSCCENGFTDIVSLLIEKGADLNFATFNLGWTPVMWAAHKNHVDIVMILIQNGANVDSISHDDRTALSIALGQSHKETTKALLDLGANVNLPFEDGSTALMKACSKGLTDIVELMLEKGANPDVCNDEGKSALFLSYEIGNMSIVRALLRFGASIDGLLRNGALNDSVRKGRLEAVKLLLEFGASADQVDYLDGTTPLILAIEKGMTELVMILLERGANVNLASRSGSTPLIAACKRGNAEIASILLAFSAELDAADFDGNTSVMHACDKGQHLDIISLLVSQGANLERVNSRCQSARDLAKRHSAVVRLLQSMNV